MINQQDRERLAEGLRHLANGRITNDEFEDQYGRSAAGSRDGGVRAVFWQGAWLLYSDFEERRFAGPRRLPRDSRRHIVRWIMFLRSSRPYEWPLQRWWAKLAWLPVDTLRRWASALGFELGAGERAANIPSGRFVDGPITARRYASRPTCADGGTKRWRNFLVRRYSHPFGQMRPTNERQAATTPSRRAHQAC